LNHFQRDESQEYNAHPMAKKSKLEMCVRCKKHRAVVGAFTSYYGVRLQGSSQIKGSFPARGYCLKCLLKRATREGLSSAKRDGLRKKLKPRGRASRHQSKHKK
jgi:hypothetical protein